MSPFFTKFGFTAVISVTSVVDKAESRDAESWWGCSDSDTGSDSGLLIDSDSGSDSGSDTKYKIDKTLIVERVSAVNARKKT